MPERCHESQVRVTGEALYARGRLHSQYRLQTTRRTDLLREVFQCPDAANLRVENTAKVNDELAIITVQRLAFQ